MAKINFYTTDKAEKEAVFNAIAAEFTAITTTIMTFGKQ